MSISSQLPPHTIRHPCTPSPGRQRIIRLYICGCLGMVGCEEGLTCGLNLTWKHTSMPAATCTHHPDTRGGICRGVINRGLYGVCSKQVCR